MLRITVDLLSVKLPRAAARALVCGMQNMWGAPSLQLIKVRR